MAAQNVKKIESKITGFSVEKPKPAAVEEPGAETPPAPVAQADDVVLMNETLARPDLLTGTTYKVKVPVSEHAMYVTINDIVLNAGTPHEQRRPFEMFINSKNLEHYQWIIALTRIISAVFRKGGDCTFLVEELKAVFDPQGGYWQKGGKFMPSIVAELGHVVEQHLRLIGMLPDDELDEEAKKLIEEKRAAFEALAREQSSEPPTVQESQYPAGATMCPRCSTKAVVKLDGCATCLSCGNSKCS